VSVANLLYYFSGNADNILVGRFLGQAPLGLYARAYNLFLVPLRQLHSPLANVVQPVMAAIIGEPDRYRRFYCRVVSGITIVGMPVVVVLAVMSRQVIELVLGPRWLAAADPFRWLAIAGFFGLVSRTYTWLFTTSGRARPMALSAAVSAPLIVAAFGIGLHWGITGVAAGYAIAQTALAIPGLWYATRHTPVRMADVLAAAWRPAVVAVACGLVAFAVRDALFFAAAPAQLAGAGGASLACWLALVACWPAVRAELNGLRGLSRSRGKHRARR
jgi:PST family polysaccharide transporter